MSDHKITPEQRAAYSIEAARSFVQRSLNASRMVASAAQRGEKRVVEQYLASLESLQVEADRWFPSESQAESSGGHQ